MECAVVGTDKIVKINEKVSSGVLLRDLDSIYSSYMYYDDIKLQIMSIICNLLKGHYFVDGNKRTSVLLLYILSKYNNVKLSITNDVLDDVIVQIIEDNLSVEDSAKLIFN